MNVFVSFSLHFVGNMLNLPSGSFHSAPSSIYRVIAFDIIFQAFSLLLNDLCTLINICSICPVLKTR